MFEGNMNDQSSARASRAWGSGRVDLLFGDGPVAPTPWSQMSRRRSHADYDLGVLSELLDEPPVLTEIDPRGLRSTQPALTRPGVAYYLTRAYVTTGRTYADYDRTANRYPVVYRREDGQDLIISGHHRAAAALLDGCPLSARLVGGPWGPPRAAGAQIAPSSNRKPGDPATTFLIPSLTVGARPSWSHELVSSQDRDIVRLILEGTRCHLETDFGREDQARLVHRYLVELGLSPVDAAAQARFASTGNLRPPDRRGNWIGSDHGRKPEEKGVKELSVHVDCAGVRGPLPLSFVGDVSGVERRQHCSCEGEFEKWPDTDVSQLYALCALCQRGLAGGVTRWSWLACRLCRDVNSGFAATDGSRPLALGRHSIMNMVRAKAQSVETEERVRAFVFTNRVQEKLGLWAWHKLEVRKMAQLRGWKSDDDIPLRLWQETFRASAGASVDAFRRFTGLDPLAVSGHE